MRLRMPPVVRDAYHAEIDISRTSENKEAAWRALERAHILSQPWPVAHTDAAHRCTADGAADVGDREQ